MEPIDQLKNDVFSLNLNEHIQRINNKIEITDKNNHLSYKIVNITSRIGKTNQYKITAYYHYIEVAHGYFSKDKNNYVHLAHLTIFGKYFKNTKYHLTLNLEFLIEYSIHQIAHKYFNKLNNAKDISYLNNLLAKKQSNQKLLEAEIKAIKKILSKESNIKFNK